jgi:hypothetical protein
MSDFNPPLPPYPPTPALPPSGYVFPMSFGQILDRIFRLVRSHLRPFLAIGMFPIGVMFAIFVAIIVALYLGGVFVRPPAQPSAAAILWIAVPADLLFIPVMFVMYGLFYGASTYAALQADHDVKVTAGEAFSHAWSRLGRYVWLMVLRSLIVAIPIVVVALAVGVGGLMLGLFPKGGNPDPAALFFLIPLFILFYLGAIVYAILMSLRLSLAFPACVHENITAMQSIKRSGVLTPGAKGRIFLVLLDRLRYQLYRHDDPVRRGPVCLRHCRVRRRRQPCQPHLPHHHRPGRRRRAGCDRRGARPVRHSHGRLLRGLRRLLPRPVPAQPGPAADAHPCPRACMTSTLCAPILWTSTIISACTVRLGNSKLRWS